MTITRANYPSIAAGLNLNTLPPDLKATYDLIVEYNPGYGDWATFFDLPEGLEVQNLYFQTLGEYLDSLVVPTVVPPTPIVPVVSTPPVQPVAPVQPVSPPTGGGTVGNPVFIGGPAGGAVVGVVQVPGQPVGNVIGNAVVTGSQVYPVVGALTPVSAVPTNPLAAGDKATSGQDITINLGNANATNPTNTPDAGTTPKWLPYVLGGFGLIVVIAVVVFMFRKTNKS